MIDVSVIIVTYNSARVIKTCLDSIIRETTHHSFEIIVSDNASSDHTASIIKNYTGIKLISNGANLGFSKANNIALKQAQGKYILFLNPDTEVRDGGIDLLLDQMEHEPSVGMLTGAISYPDGRHQPNVKRNLTLLSLLELFLALKFSGITKYFKSLQRHLANDFDYARSQHVEQIMGACMLVREKEIRAMGGFDEDYFIWFEDLQLCLDYQKRGWIIAYTPVAHFVHHEGHAFNQQARWWRQLNFLRSTVTFADKNWPLSHRLVVWFLSPFALLLSIFIALFGTRPKTQTELR